MVEVSVDVDVCWQLQLSPFRDCTPRATWNFAA